MAPLVYLAGASATMTGGNYLTTEGRQPQDDLDALWFTLRERIAS